MKTFLAIDFFVQISVLTFTVLYILLYTLAGKQDLIWNFYYIVGFSQFISFIIRLFLGQNKSVYFKIYSLFILPIWFSFLFMFIFQDYRGDILFIDNIGKQCAIILVSSLFYSPIMAIIYIYECYKSDKNYEKSSL